MIIRPTIVSLTSDFGVQTQGIGIMEATVVAIAPTARVIHLMHGLPPFNLFAAARTMETVQFMPLGAHVCVCDPGVGTSRKGIICRVERGDYLIGPDNGVLLAAARVLGGIAEARQLTNAALMRQPVSPLFHGRDVFAPAAGHIVNGSRIEDFGPELSPDSLVQPPYAEAENIDGRITCRVIQINHFGSLHLNILHGSWDSFGLANGDLVSASLPDGSVVKLTFVTTFGDVPIGAPLIVRDDYGRVEVAINQGRFADRYHVDVGDSFTLALPISRHSRL